MSLQSFFDEHEEFIKENIVPFLFPFVLAFALAFLPATIIYLLFIAEQSSRSSSD